MGKAALIFILATCVLFVSLVCADPHAHGRAAAHDHEHDHGHGHEHDHAAEKPKSNVVELDFSNFGDYIKNNDYVFVEFYAPWCGHCRHLAPVWEQLATEFANEGSHIKIAKVDAAQDTLLAQEYEIQGFPTLKLFKKGNPVDYEGGRDISSLRNWAIRKTSPAVQKLDDAAKAKAFSHGLVGYFPEADSALKKAFSDAADAIEFDGWNFAEVTTAELAKELNLAPNQPQLIQVGKPSAALTLTENTDAVAVRKFICQHGYTDAEEISQSVYQRLEQCGRPFVIYFYTDKTDADDFVAKVASKFAGKIGISLADTTRWKDVLVRMGGSGTFLPTIIAFITKNNNEIVLAWNEEVPLTHESAEAWFNDILAGTAKGFLKSEPIPDNTGKPVTVIVGRTFEEIVKDPKKDVLVEFYAPWCPHCKNLEPAYNQLGSLVTAATSDVVIAKIDATANTLPEDVAVSGFPTIHFYKAGDKANPIVYEGDRAVQDLAVFVQSHATNKFELDLSKLPETPEEGDEYAEDDEEEDADEEDDENEEEEEDDEEEDEGDDDDSHLKDEL